MNIENYLAEHDAQLLGGGKSGAQVYGIDGKYVLKYVQRKQLGDEKLFTAYRKEALWYEDAAQSGLRCLPEIFDIQSTGEEIVILMKRYQALSRREIEGGLLKKIMEALAAVHTAELPQFLKQERYAAKPLSDIQIQEATEGWRSVLQEHPSAFDAGALERIAEKINEIIRWHDAEEAVLNHGDFHWDNLLQDEKGNIIICDWQGVSAGQASGDLSFFFSRLQGDGIALNRPETIGFYEQAVKRLSGKPASREEIEGHIRAANVITSFAFWHRYLHGSAEERVREIYGKMAEDSEGLKACFRYYENIERGCVKR